MSPIVRIDATASFCLKSPIWPCTSKLRQCSASVPGYRADKSIYIDIRLVQLNCSILKS